MQEPWVFRYCKNETTITKSVHVFETVFCVICNNLKLSKTFVDPSKTSVKEIVTSFVTKKKKKKKAKYDIKWFTDPS